MVLTVMVLCLSSGTSGYRLHSVLWESQVWMLTLKCNTKILKILNVLLEVGSIFSCIQGQIGSYFERVSSLICGNKMPTGCNRDFYCRSYCLINKLIKVVRRYLRNGTLFVESCEKVFKKQDTFVESC